MCTVISSAITESSPPAVAGHKKNCQLQLGKNSNAWTIAYLVGAEHFYSEVAAITQKDPAFLDIFILQAEYTDGILTIVALKDPVRPAAHPK